jgi:hypothetical protein
LCYYVIECGNGWHKNAVLSHLFTFVVPPAYEKHAGLGLRDGDGGLPGDLRESGVGLIQLRRANKQTQAAAGSYEAGGHAESVFEMLDGAESDYFVSLGDGFGASVLYIDVRQCKGAHDFVEEGGFLVIGLDQGEGDTRGPEFDWNSRETGAGAEVGQASQTPDHSGNTGKEVAGGEKGFAEVAGDDFFRIPDGGEVDAGIPAN